MSLNLNRGLTLRLTDELIEFCFDECRDALAVSPECCGESLLGLVVDVVGPAKNGVTGDLRMIDADHTE